MAKFNERQVKEINEIIETINKAIEAAKKTKFEIGARDKTVLSILLKANTGKSKVTAYFPCRREYSDAIISHFVKEKGLVRSRFSMNAQQHIFLLS